MRADSIELLRPEMILQGEPDEGWLIGADWARFFKGN